MRPSVFLIVLFASIWASPLRSATVYDFFVNKGSIELALRVEILRNHLLSREAVADCIAWKFGPTKSRDSGFWGLERDIYSTPAPNDDTVESFIASELVGACRSATTSTWQPQQATQFLRKFSVKDFFAETHSALTKTMVIEVAVATQRLIDYEEKNVARGDCIKNKLKAGAYFGPQPNWEMDLAIELAEASDSSDDVAAYINRAIVRACGEDREGDGRPRVSEPTNAPAPVDDAERKELQAWDDFMRELDGGLKTTSQMILDEKAKLNAANARLAEMASHAYRVPDGRRIYPRRDGKWLFENLEFVPSELVSRRIPPPDEGWPTLDMRSPP